MDLEPITRAESERDFRPEHWPQTATV